MVSNGDSLAQTLAKPTDDLLNGGVFLSTLFKHQLGPGNEYIMRAGYESRH